MKLHKGLRVCLLVVFLSSSLVACQTGIRRKALILSPESLKDRQMQTRIFETNDEKNLLTASAAVLQDMGFILIIDQSEVRWGVIVCSRDRDVIKPAEMVLGFIVSLLSGARVPLNYKEKVLASLVTKPLDERRIAVRITFQHMVWNTDEKLTKNEQINDPEIYQEFFSKLSKSVFLGALDI